MKALPPKALERSRTRNLAALDRLNAKISADKQRVAARVREREASKRNRAPRSLDDLERLGMVIDLHALRRRGDVLVTDRASTIAPPPGLRRLTASRHWLWLTLLDGSEQAIALRWRSTVGPFELCAARCPCGGLTYKIYPSGLDGSGPWGCRRCSAVGDRRDSRDKHRGVNRIRVRPAVFLGASGLEVCGRDERGRFLPRSKEPFQPAPEPPQPVVHRPFGPCDWTPSHG
jgi:hypothetical protein